MREVVMTVWSLVTGWECHDSLSRVNTLSRPRPGARVPHSYLGPVSLTFPLPPSVITTMGDSGGFYAKIPTTLGPVCLSLPTLTDSAAETVKMPKEILGKADKVIKPTYMA